MSQQPHSVPAFQNEEAINNNVPRAEIALSLADKVTFATQQNDVAVIADLAVRNTGSALLENVELILECEPPLIAKKTWKLDRIATNAEVRIRDRTVSLAAAMLSEMSERVRADVKVTLCHKDGGIIAEEHRKLTGLARNEWGGASFMPELLAAFVMPNDPAIADILKSAGEVLRAGGHQPSLDGYQSRSRQRVWQIASAIWTAIASKRLVYAVPPASFEREGQKIRTPSEVRETGLATCLDTTVLFAAALEQAGLNAVVAFTEGHAFCGVWLQPQQLPALTADDASDLRKYIGLQELALFETTLVVHEPPVSFSKAVDAGSRAIAEDKEHEFIYAIDIKRARQQQITPLAAMLAKSAAMPADDNTSPVMLGLELAPDLPSFDLGLDTSPAPETAETRIDHWKRKLLDLTKRNRLLNLKPSKTAIRLYCSNSGILEDKLALGKKISVTPMTRLPGQAGTRDNALFVARTGDDFTKRFVEEALERDEVVSDLSQDDLDAGMVELYRKAKSDLQEGGANTLYLAVGILKWKQTEKEERSYRAPLILVPVTLERKSAASRVKISQHDDEPVFNMTLLEMLRQDFSLRMPELEGELPKDDAGVDVARIFEIVKRAVRDIAGFEFVDEMVLSTFSFAKYLMWKDLADRTEDLKKSAFVHHLIEKPRDPYGNSASFMMPRETDEKISPADLFMPLSADSSQIVAVHASAKGGDFILEGPPGTGKSQTIGNIIAHNLALGRKVMFVSEKMAALEVVYKRLREKGLGDFCLELHSSKANKRHVLDQLAQSWHNREARSEFQWQQETARLKTARDNLNKLVKALHTPAPSGISPRTAIGRVVKWQNIHRFRLDWAGSIDQDPIRSEEQLSEFMTIARRVGQVYAEINAEDKQAFKDIEKSEWSNAWQSDVVRKSQSLLSATESLQAARAQLCERAKLPFASEESLQVLRGLSKIAQVFPLIAKYSLSFAFEAQASSVFDSYQKALELVEKYRSVKMTLSASYDDERLLKAPIAEWKQDFEKIGKSVWPMGAIRKRSLGNKVKAALSAEETPSLDVDLNLIADIQSIYADIKKAAEDLPTSVYWKDLNTDLDKAHSGLDAARSLREAIAKTATDLEKVAELRSAIKTICTDGQDLVQPEMPIAIAGGAFIKALEAYEEALAQFAAQAELRRDHFDGFEDTAKQAKRIIDLQPRINAWCRWQSVRKEAASIGLMALTNALEIGAIDAAQSENEFRTAYCAWVGERLIDSRPELTKFSTLEHEERIQEFRNLDQRVSELSVDYIRAKLSAGIPRPDQQNRPEGYGVLSRELQKRMRHKPVRQLVREMGDSLTTLTPCLLMSPLSVAQFLAADQQLFDLVVFDEASQITVWDAIGAIARGRNVIVVGDPKQMPPTSFFDRAASDEAEEDNNTDDLESILDEALAASVKLHRLTGHYRSRHESLIAFSNHRYYGGELVTYPSAETKQSAVSHVLVDGVYQRGRGRTNPEEAKAVVKEVLRRLNDPRLNEKSIGVVALNSEQQKLIDDLLDQERRKNPDLEKFFNESTEEPVFIKNLETVQGDQRDVILLSIGYGPDTPGAKTMSMNFGPLNRKGGERRLNVAITRATSEVVIFSSFDPGLIDLTRTSAQAVRDLKHYLEYAQRGPSALGEAVHGVGGLAAYDSDFEEAVAEALRKKGWTIHTQIGVSKFRVDLGVVHPDFAGKYLAGVECDGATYHSSPTARDRDRVRHNILVSLGWDLVRIWSTDFWIDPARAIEIVDSRLQGLLRYDRDKQAAAAAQAEAEIVAQLVDDGEDADDEINSLDPDDGIEAQVVTGAETTISAATVTQSTSGFAPTQDVLTQLSPQKFYEKDYLAVLSVLSGQIIDGLGPVTFKALSTKVARLHGFNRTGSQIKKQVWAAISKKRKHVKSPNGETVFWPEGQDPQAVLSFRGMVIEGELRSWQDVPYPERLGLAVKIAHEFKQDPVAAMAKNIGLGRLAQTTKQELEALLLDAAAVGKQ